MSSLAQLYLPGAVTLWCAVFFALAALWGYARVLRGDATALRFARRGYLFFALSVVLTAVVLFLALARRDFRIEYVSQYSGLDLPMHYQVAAFWAGQKGSFLVWLLWGALLGLPLGRSAGRDEAPVMGVYLLTLFGLLFILVRENPFVMLDHTPLDGAGLNPLLQDDWMVIHPPIMFIGYAAGAIPFAFAVAALWRRDTSRWAARAFPWALGGFLVLGTAILMGGYWAYKTLGWGGYWGWDPVENASLVPWLFGVVLIHGLHLERTRGRFRRANLVFACLVYLSVLYSTYLTRSGVLADFSVHSFVELGISEWLVLMQLFFLGTSVYLLATRMKRVDTRANEDPLLSRGFAMVLATTVVLLATLVIAAGTSAPLLTAWQDNPGQVGPSFYNRTNLPLAIAIALLLAAVPYLTWRGIPTVEVGALRRAVNERRKRLAASGEEPSGEDRDALAALEKQLTAAATRRQSELPRYLRHLAPAAVAALVVAGVAVTRGVTDPFHLVFVLLAALALASNLSKAIALVRSGGLGRAGGYLTHVGVGILLLGVLASSAYDQSAKVTLEQGVPLEVGDLTLTFNRVVPRQGHEKERMEIEVARADGFRYTAYPRLFVNDRTRQLMANPHVRSLPLKDIYISPIQYLPPDTPQVEERLTLARGESAQVGPLGIQFTALELPEGANPMVQLAGGGTVSVGARLAITRDGETSEVTPRFRFREGGQVSSPPADLPGGALVALTRIDPAAGTVELALAGLTTPLSAATLAIDVTRKPLIQLVWIGLYAMLLGGGVATVHRLRGARQVDAIAERVEQATAGRE